MYLDSDVKSCKAEEEQVRLQRQLVFHTFSSLTEKDFVKNRSRQFSQSFVLCLGFSEDFKTQLVSLYSSKVPALTLGIISSSL